jgi:hypothetical protein
MLSLKIEFKSKIENGNTQDYENIDFVFINKSKGFILIWFFLLFFWISTRFQLYKKLTQSLREFFLNIFMIF